MPDRPEPYYSDELVTLFLGDCREITEWLAADVLVTDPPYGIGWSIGAGTGQQRAGQGNAGISGDKDTSIRDSALISWGAKPALVFGSFDAAPPPGRKQTLVWRKWAGSGVIGSVTGWRRDVEPIFVVGDWPKRAACRSALLAAQGTVKGTIGLIGHPHTKPANVLEDLIAACPPGAIADPFAGSGSTLVAARNLGRHAIGVELEERYCERAARRLSQSAFDFGEAS